MANQQEAPIIGRVTVGLEDGTQITGDVRSYPDPGKPGGRYVALDNRGDDLATGPVIPLDDPTTEVSKSDSDIE